MKKPYLSMALYLYGHIRVTGIRNVSKLTAAMIRQFIAQKTEVLKE
ncbi:MAG: hypothetical protein LIP12_10350 [Clostridiales bacterium]|nr:hypothetical protein [Clostridiales bacterium]